MFFNAEKSKKLVMYERSFFHGGFSSAVLDCTDTVLVQRVVFVLSEKEKLKMRHYKKCVVLV